LCFGGLFRLQANVQVHKDHPERGWGLPIEFDYFRKRVQTRIGNQRSKSPHSSASINAGIVTKTRKVSKVHATIVDEESDDSSDGSETSGSAAAAHGTALLFSTRANGSESSTQVRKKQKTDSPSVRPAASTRSSKVRGHSLPTDMHRFFLLAASASQLLTAQ
jgi:hypothetical protein